MDLPRLPLCHHFSINMVPKSSSLHQNGPNQISDTEIILQQAPERDKSLHPFFINFFPRPSDIISTVQYGRRMSHPTMKNSWRVTPLHDGPNYSSSSPSGETSNYFCRTHSNLIYSRKPFKNQFSSLTLPPSTCMDAKSSLCHHSICGAFTDDNQPLISKKIYNNYPISLETGSNGNRNNNNSNGSSEIKGDGKEKDSKTKASKNRIPSSSPRSSSYMENYQDHSSHNKNSKYDKIQNNTNNSDNNSRGAGSAPNLNRQGLNNSRNGRPEKKCCFCWCGCCTCSWLPIQIDRGNSMRDSKLDSMIKCDTEPLTYKEVCSWGQSFDRLMKTANGRNTFRDFLRHEYSEENMLFWLACEELKKERSQEAIEEKARLIYEDYISILSPKEVSLDSRVREIINKKMVDPSKETFDEAQMQIYTLMHRDSYPRFLNSAFYKNIKEQYRNTSDKV